MTPTGQARTEQINRLLDQVYEVMEGMDHGEIQGFVTTIQEIALRVLKARLKELNENIESLNSRRQGTEYVINYIAPDNNSLQPTNIEITEEEWIKMHHRNHTVETQTQKHGQVQRSGVRI